MFLSRKEHTDGGFLSQGNPRGMLRLARRQQLARTHKRKRIPLKPEMSLENCFAALETEEPFHQRKIGAELGSPICSPFHQ